MPVYTYTTFDVPLALDTEPLGINDSGQIVGQYRDSGGLHSFLFSNGTFTPINDPSATSSTLANGINNSGQIVGIYNPDNFDVPGFLYDPTSNVFPPYFTLHDPSANQGTVPRGINNARQIVGHYLDSTGDHGFLLSAGNYATLDDPMGARGTFANGINDAGQIVGFYQDSGNKLHGFLYNPTNGSFTTLDDPLATSGTIAWGINDTGEIVGSFGSHGFLYRNGAYTTLDDPLATNGTIAVSPRARSSGSTSMQTVTPTASS
jgi:probable HAF family extracellular repeat protein